MDLLRGRLAPLLRELNAHPVYGSMETIEDLRIFMQSHVFAVWDFMSLLKTLQRRLTCVDVPWVPTAFPRSRRFINEIVLGEESDEYDGRPTSHFELYLEAMEQVEADTSAIRRVVARAADGVVDACGEGVPEAARRFLEGTFAVIREGSAAAQAAVFAFGREDAIPDMFSRAGRESVGTVRRGDVDPYLVPGTAHRGGWGRSRSAGAGDGGGSMCGGRHGVGRGGDGGGGCASGSHPTLGWCRGGDGASEVVAYACRLGLRRVTVWVTSMGIFDSMTHSGCSVIRRGVRFGRSPNKLQTRG